MDVKNPGLVNVVNQAFKPTLAADVSTFPTPPLNPFLAAEQGPPLVTSPLDSIPTAPTIEVQDVPALDPDVIDVTTVNNYETNPNKAEQVYTIASVVDAATLAAPSPSPIPDSLLITFAAGAPLASYGIDLTTKLLYFLTGAWISPPGSTPFRPITLVGPNTYKNGIIVQSLGPLSLIIPNQDANGVPFAWPNGPTAGNTVKFDVARVLSQVVFGNGGGPLIVPPQPTPVPVETGTITAVSTKNVVVIDQSPPDNPVDVHVP
jgi:hypothetical protein